MNMQENGDNEIHTYNCPHPPLHQNREGLGHFSTCREAVRMAKQKYPRANGCYYCVPECHTS